MKQWFERLIRPGTATGRWGGVGSIHVIASLVTVSIVIAALVFTTAVEAKTAGKGHRLQACLSLNTRSFHPLSPNGSCPSNEVLITFLDGVQQIPGGTVLLIKCDIRPKGCKVDPPPPPDRPTGPSHGMRNER